MSYNGWSNYETWCVNLWLENEPGTYEDKRDIIRRARDKWAAAQGLKSYAQDLLPDLGPSFAADLLQAAFDDVDWQEIVDNAWDEEHEEEEAEV
jgi:hypothetical protein